MTSPSEPRSPGTEARVEPVDTLAEAIDTVMPILVDLDPDWQSRWSTAALLIEELRLRGYRVERESDGSLDAAWHAAAAALPDGWRITNHLDSGRGTPHACQVVANDTAVADGGTVSGYGPDLPAALHALAARLAPARNDAGETG